jgi:hypothetical protein
MPPLIRASLNPRIGATAARLTRSSTKVDASPGLDQKTVENLREGFGNLAEPGEKFVTVVSEGKAT